LDKPEYPIKVIFFNGGEECVYKNEEEMVCDLEFFDSEDNDPEDATLVTDGRGREVILKIESLDLLKFELKEIP